MSQSWENVTDRWSKFIDKLIGPSSRARVPKSTFNIYLPPWSNRAIKWRNNGLPLHHFRVDIFQTKLMQQIQPQDIKYNVHYAKKLWGDGKIYRYCPNCDKLFLFISLANIEHILATLETCWLLLTNDNRRYFEIL